MAEIEFSAMYRQCQMRQVVNRLYTFQMKCDDLIFVAMMDRALAQAWSWDEPELDEMIV